MEKLPDYMKIFYKALLETFEEIEEHMIKLGTSYRLDYGIEAVIIITTLIVCLFWPDDSKFNYECDLWNLFYENPPNTSDCIAYMYNVDS